MTHFPSCKIPTLNAFDLLVHNSIQSYFCAQELCELRLVSNIWKNFVDQCNFFKVLKELRGEIDISWQKLLRHNQSTEVFHRMLISNNSLDSEICNEIFSKAFHQKNVELVNKIIKYILKIQNQGTAIVTDVEKPLGISWNRFSNQNSISTDNIFKIFIKIIFKNKKKTKIISYSTNSNKKLLDECDSSTTTIVVDITKKYFKSLYVRSLN